MNPLPPSYYSAGDLMSTLLNSPVAYPEQNCPFTEGRYTRPSCPGIPARVFRPGYSGQGIPAMGFQGISASALAGGQGGRLRSLILALRLPDGKGRGLRSPHAQLGKQGGRIILDGLLRQGHVLCDLLVGQPVADQVKYPLLLVGQR